MTTALSGHSLNTRINNKYKDHFLSQQATGEVQIKTWKCLTSHPLDCSYQSGGWWQVPAGMWKLVGMVKPLGCRESGHP